MKHIHKITSGKINFFRRHAKHGNTGIHIAHRHGADSHRSSGADLTPGHYPRAWKHRGAFSDLNTAAD
jgi:hypothetical protein